MNKKNSSGNYVHLIIGYMIFCLTVLMIMSVILSKIISRNNSNQINNTLSLVAEKTNTSIDMMTDYITEASDIISAKENFSFEESYSELQNTLRNMPYYSTGLISDSGDIYGSPGEVMDIEKHGFAEAAASSDKIFITEPYRSSVTASNMISIFAPIYQNDKHIGSMFVTYYLETIQDLAYTDSLSDTAYVFLINPYSGNFVSCSYDGENNPGTWGNVRLIKNDIKCMGDYNLDTWLYNMEQKSEDNIINFRRNNIAFAQAYISIKAMDNWNLAIRIPISELSDTMQQYTFGVGICAALIVLATIFLAGLIYIREHNRAKLLRIMSDIDPLTKAINRRGFNEALAKIFSAKTKPVRSTFIFVDIDYFKSVNDGYGHAAGDKVLCCVAEILRSAFDGMGIVARTGGDEFNVFVYRPLSVADIDNIMANIRIEFENIVLDDGTPLPCSFSAGLAVYPEDAQSKEKLIECADKALYHVKENGRKNHFWYNDL